VLRIPRAHIAPAPTLSAEQSRLISRVANLQGDKRLVMLIDPRHLLQGSELQAVHGGAAEIEAEAEPMPLAKAA
jgi:purine-binding chemotaxis protein CheW